MLKEEPRQSSDLLPLLLLVNISFGVPFHGREQTLRDIQGPDVSCAGDDGDDGVCVLKRWKMSPFPDKITLFLARKRHMLNVRLELLLLLLRRKDKK